MHTATAFATLALLTSTAFAQPTFITLVPPTPEGRCFATAMSRDGNTIVGNAAFGAGVVPFIWKRETGFTFNPPVGLGQTAVRNAGVSSSGDFALAYDILSRDSFRTTTTVSQNLGRPWTPAFDGTFNSSGSMWSNAGATRIIASASRTEQVGVPPERNPFVWTQETNSWQRLIPSSASGSSFVRVYGASDDAHTVVGQVNEGNALGQTRGFVYSTSSGYSLLTQPTPGSIGWYATAVSGDGSIVAGASGEQPVNSNAVIWNANIPTVIPNLPGIESTTPLGISDDGSVMVGTFDGPGTQGRNEGFVWTPQTGTRPLRDLLGDYGFSLPPIVDIAWLDVSADGQTIAGADAFTQSSFVFTIPTPASLSLFALGFVVAARRKR